MPLIDGKFEIISERAISAEQTLFDATAPDGSAVQIVWYNLQPAQEANFERYRRTVKRLKRNDRAAIYDVVSRPGAHYVAWHAAADARPSPADAELRQLLRDAGFSAEDADVRRSNGKARIYGLAFDGSPLPVRRGEEERELPRRRTRSYVPPAWLLTTGVTLLLVIAAAALITGGLNARSNNRVVTVPQVLGSPVNEASRRLHGLGLQVAPVPVASEEPSGTVISSDPEVGSNLRPGRSIRLAYALPAGSVTPVEVPQLVTRSFPDGVEQVLADLDLSLGTISRIPADQAAGLVISQNPNAGETVGAGSQVDILLSAGPSRQLTFLPDLTELPLEDARYFAQLAGLSPDRIIEDFVATAASPPGTVIGQSLKPNQPVPRSEAVLRLIVAGSSDEARGAGAGLPSVVGLNIEEARDLLPSGRPVQLSELSNRSLPEGIVDQQPPAGSTAEGPVTLFVNLHPVPIPRPDATANVRGPEPRELEFSWFIEPGIPEQEARVYATTLEGERRLALVREVRGGELLSGSWRTSNPGPIRFSLTLNDQPYGGEQLVR